jgi:hypothetical protein
MDKPRFWANMFCEMGQKRDDIMLHFAFDCVDPGDVECNIFRFPNRSCAPMRDHAKFGLRVRSMRFNLKPNAKF